MSELCPGTPAGVCLRFAQTEGIKAVNLLLHFACVRRGGQGRPPLQTLRRGFLPQSPAATAPSWQRGPFSKSSPERIAFRAGSGEKKTFSPRCPSSFLNLKSSENCLIERERGFLPLSLFPRCSIAGLRFIVFLTVSQPPPRGGCFYVSQM